MEGQASEAVASDANANGEVLRLVAKDGPRIQTARLLLRPLEDSDVEGVYAMRSRMDVMKWSAAGKPDDSLEFTRQRLLTFNNDDALGFVIVEPASPRDVIGIVSFWTTDGKVELGYLFHPRSWGKGYATEAVRAAVDAWWTKAAKLETDERNKSNADADEDAQKPSVQYSRVYAITHKDNDRSNGVLGKCGFRLQGEIVDEYGEAFEWLLEKSL